MVRLDDGAEILVRKNGGAQVAALAWNAKGTHAGVCRGGRRRRAAAALVHFGGFSALTKASMWSNTLWGGSSVS